MSKKLLKIKIQTKPVLKEGPRNVDTLLLEFKRLTAELLELSPKARKAKEAFIAFSKSAAVAKATSGAAKRTNEIGRVITDLNSYSKRLGKVLEDADFIFKKSLNNSAEANKLKNADEVLSGLEDISESFRAIVKNKKIYSVGAVRQAGFLLEKTTEKITALKALKESSPTYIALAAKRAKEAGRAVDDVVDVLPKKVKFKDSEYATKELVDALGKEGAEQFAKKNSKWRKWLYGAGLLATATAMYRVGTKKADADDKKPTPTPTPTPAGGGVTIGSYDLFNQLAVQVTGQKDVKQAVKAIQEILVNLGYSVKKGETDSGFGPGKGMVPSTKFKSAGIDGKVGEGTQGAVIRFQKANGLKPDGLVGPNTYAKLMSVAKGGDKKKEPEGKISSGQAKSAGKSIAEIVNELSRRGEQGGFQHIINAYIEISRALVTKLMGGRGFDGDLSMAAGSEAGLRKLVQNVLPPMPAGASPEKKMNHASETLMMLPIRIQNSTINSIDTGIKPKQIVQLAIKILNEKLKIDFSVPDAADKEDMTLEESKKYDLDFSKWSKIF
tara:strand:- start:6118 stop:7779 length:1662 start_codon:yes stop_codon:yes gene_type:complete